jgi:hypothetical protein
MKVGMQVDGYKGDGWKNDLVPFFLLTNIENSIIINSFQSAEGALGCMAVCLSFLSMNPFGTSWNPK